MYRFQKYSPRRINGIIQQQKQERMGSNRKQENFGCYALPEFETKTSLRKRSNYTSCASGSSVDDNTLHSQVVTTK